MNIISSSNNGQIKSMLKLLKSSKARKTENAFIVEGIKMFREAKELGVIKKAFVSEEFWEENKQDKTLFEGVYYDVVSSKVMKEISDTITPQGVVAIVEKITFDFKEILAQPECRLIFLEDLRDPGNLGTIIRTAEGAGITGIILSKESADVYNPKVVRSTMGSIFRIPHIYVEDFHSALKEAQSKNITLYATHLNGNQYFDEVEYSTKAGIIIGNEANGIKEETAEMADCLVKIPMCGKVESLNAAVASSIMMYELYRQIRTKV